MTEDKHDTSLGERIEAGICWFLAGAFAFLILLLLPTAFLGLSETLYTYIAVIGGLVVGALGFAYGRKPPLG
ncbi:MAG: hypothetical protein ACR2PO_05770 [Methyloligellaceae bacterium]